MCIWTDPRAAFVEDVDLDAITQEDYDKACEALIEAPDPGPLPLPGPIATLSVADGAHERGLKAEQLLKLMRATKAPAQLEPDASRI